MYLIDTTLVRVGILIAIDVDKLSIHNKTHSLDAKGSNTMNICPHCNSSFDWNDPQSGHQVNDNFELIFCSYECSVVYTAHYIKNNSDTLSKDDIVEMLDIM